MEHDWPHKVAVPIPDGGFGWRFAHLLWAARNNGSPRHWEDREHLVFGFYDPVDAADFRTWLKASAIDWRCPPEWPQVEPASPPGAVIDRAAPRPQLDPDELSDWVRGAVRRGLARRVIGAFLKGRRGRPYGSDGTRDAMMELALIEPDMDLRQREAAVRAICDWTRAHHGKWFERQLHRYDRNQ